MIRRAHLSLAAAQLYPGLGFHDHQVGLQKVPEWAVRVEVSALRALLVPRELAARTGHKDRLAKLRADL